MKIRNITLFRCERPFSLGFASSKATRTKTEAIIIRLDCDSAVSGFGESTPRHYVTGETIETVSHAIRDVMAEVLLGESFSSIEDIEGILSVLSRICEKESGRLCNSALGAVDLALLDAMGKNLGAPAHGFLGSLRRDSLPYSLSIPLLPLSRIRDFLPLIDAHSFSSLKILAGRDRSDILDRLRFVREEIGFQDKITIEANGAWTADEAIDILNHAGIFGIAWAEQPTAKGDLEGMQRVKEATGIPIIADESMCSLSDARLLIDQKACDAVNIKISKCGGLLRSKEIALFAHAHGVRCRIGAHVGETEILSAAGRALARTVPEILHYDGFSSILFKNIKKNEPHRANENDRDRKCKNGLGIEFQSQGLTEIWSS